jgi:hypothetical protein
MVLAVLGLTACSSGGDDAAAPSASGAVVSGGVQKGIIAAGVVSAYGITDGAVSATPIAATTTDENGQYSLTLPAGYAGAVKVKITAAADTTMKCDIPTGCSGDSLVAFGEDYPLPAGFNLSALVPVVTNGATVSANISAMTDMAAARVQQLADGGPGFSADLIAAQNSQVGDLFGLTSLLVYEVVDITNPDAVAGASDADRKAAMLSAALLSAALAETGATDLVAAMASLNDSFTTYEGQLIANDTDADGGQIISMQDVTAQMVAVLGAVKTRATEMEVTLDLAALESSTGAALAVLDDPEQTPPSDTTVTTAEPSPTVASSELLKTKALVADLRDLAYATSESDSAAGKLMLGAEQFKVQLDTAALASSLDTEAVLEAASYAVQAIAMTWAEDIFPVVDGLAGTYTKDVLTDVFWTAGGPVQNFVRIDVVVTKNSDGYTFAVNNEDMAGVAVALTAVMTGVVEITEDVASMAAVLTDAKVALAGTVGNGAVALTIAEGSYVSIDGNFDETGTEDTTGWSSHATFKVNSVGLDLVAELQQLASVKVTNPVAFNGQVIFTATNINADFVEVGSSSQDPMAGVWQESDSETVTSSFATANLTLSGAFADSLSHSFAATLLVVADGTGFELLQTDTWSQDWSDGNYSSAGDSTTSAETGFVKLGFTLTMDAALPGLSEAAKVTITGDRTTFADGSATVELAYEGKRFVAEGAFTRQVETGVVSGTVTITNQDNVELTFNVAADQSVAGTITVADQVYANVTQLSDGMIKTTYTDGLFEVF